jgi:serine/threonine-protein kinase RsbW
MTGRLRHMNRRVPSHAVASEDIFPHLEATKAIRTLTAFAVFPASADQVRQARNFAARLLSGWPPADDAVLCVSELATNATIHSDSRKPGGHFTVRAEIRPGDRLRVEVQDQGGSWTRRGAQPEPSHDGPAGRGLVIVGRLAQDWGRSGDSETGWIVWFEMPDDRPA